MRRVSEKTCDLRDVPDWAAFFERLKDKVRFVWVQYGDTDDEIAFARWKYSVEIYQDKSLDIYNDVDGAAAQIAVMDYMVSIATTAAHLAGALAIPGWVSAKNREADFALAAREKDLPLVSNTAANTATRHGRLEKRSDVSNRRACE